MATKVGAFKKDGTVQCVKLVEELGTSKLSGFNGVWDSSSKKVIFDNGYTMQVSIAGSQDGQYTSVILSYYPESIQFMNGDNVIMKLHIDRDNSVFTNEAAYLWPTTQDYVVTSLMFNYAAGMFIYYLQCVLTAPSGESFTWRSSYTTKVNIELDQSEGSYLLRYTDRFSPPTVRMGKDGTLHCSKLIEEPIINLIDDYSGTSASPYDKLVLNNGITLAVTRDGVPAENFFRTLVLQFSSAASTTSLLFAISIMGSNIDFYDGSVPWEFKQDYPIDGYITVSTPNVYAAGQYVLTISDSTQSVNYSVTLDSSSTAFSFSPSTSGDYFILSYDMRMKVPTVRVYKDGTIKCAEVEEATVTQLRSNWGTPTKTSGKAEFTFPNGYVLRLRQQGRDVASALADNALYAFRMSTSGTSGETCMVLYKNTTTSQTTVPNYTIYDDFFKEGNSIAYCACTNPNMSFSGVYYLELLNSKGDIVGSLSNQSSSSYLFYAGTAFDVPVFDRISYSWPGSTIVKATNIFITSDNKNFLTNTGDQFMVR